MKTSLCFLPLLSFVAACNLPMEPGGSGGADNDAGTDAPVPSKCAPPTGPAIEHHTTIQADETWGPGLHVMTFGVAIRKNATLTIAPCAVVRVKKDYELSVGSGNVGDGGTLVAEGKPDEPIVFEAADADPWADILVSSQGSARLAYVTLRGGGGTYARRGASLHLFGDQYSPIKALASVDHVTVENSGKYGVYLESRGAFSPDSHDLVIRGTKGMPMSVSAPASQSIPSGTYTGNKIDAIRLSGGGYDDYHEDGVIHDRGVPYMVGGDGNFGELSVVGGPAGPATLTIEAGVTLEFPKSDRNSGLWVDRSTGDHPAGGILKVLGTAAKPVTFTSSEATPKPGDWVGIVFGAIPNAANKIDHARVEYAGGDTGTRGFSCGTPGSDDVISNEAGIAILGQPTSAFVTNTVIANSAKNGIERAWLGTTIDFMATNTFENIAFCKQTANRTPNVACPTPPVCDR